MSWVFDHSSRGSCHLKEGEQEGQKKNFGNGKCELIAIFIATMVNLSVKGEMGSVKEKREVRTFGKGKCKLIANCEFLARESANSSPILAREW